MNDADGGVKEWREEKEGVEEEEEEEESFEQQLTSEFNPRIFFDVTRVNVGVFLSVRFLDFLVISNSRRWRNAGENYPKNGDKKKENI